MINTILSNSTSELEVKKSKFIANIIKIIDEQDAKEKLDKIRKKYSDARHNCYAYIVYDNESKTKIEKSSDDREPSGTAGIPILTLIQKNNLVNVLIVVTRYFGGILLGTGGLVRAYTDSSKQALENAQIIELKYGELLEYYIEYDEFEYFKNFEFDKATKKQLLTESVKLNSTIARCSELTDDGILVMEVVNDLYAVLLNWDSINKEDAELETEMITFTNESFANEDRSLEEFDVKMAEIFTKLEGKLEAVYEDLMSYEGTLFDVQSRFVKEASEYGYKDKYDDLYKCSILKQGSLFADLNDLEDTGLTETADLDKLKDTLKSEFDRIFNEVDRSVRRGIMAQVIGSIPVYFENRTEVMDYIRSSLASCNSREELVGTINAVTEIICE